jgi:hypothetical protein
LFDEDVADHLCGRPDLDRKQLMSEKDDDIPF